MMTKISILNAVGLLRRLVLFSALVLVLGLILAASIVVEQLPVQAELEDSQRDLTCSSTAASCAGQID